MSVLATELAGRTWVALDLDGVIYQGSAALPGAVESVRALREAGLEVFFVTNGSAGTRQHVAARLRDLGVPCVADRVTTSGNVAARFARQLLGPGQQSVLVLGSSGLAQECAAEGLTATEDPRAAAAVIVGLDISFSYQRLAAALVALGRGVPLVGCNRDGSYPGVGGVLLPGCGPLLAAVEAAAGRSADAVVGKPGAAMLTDLWASTGTSQKDWFVIGDSVHSDMGMADAAGVPGVLVGDPSRGYRDLAAFATKWLGVRQ
jgi:HAD superfamily hydrolase (TIGR01450 family)